MDFSAKYDVAVIGGGIAGAAAAIQAARCGKKTVLVEKNILLGGLATSGLVYIYLPICDGNGHQICYGIAEELMRNSLELGPGEIPPNWRQEKNAPENKRFFCIFSPAAFMLSLEELLMKNGVELWLDTLVCSAESSGDRITAAVVENESGRGRIEADCFIDASGSSVLARRLRLPCIEEENILTVWALNHAEEQSSAFGKNLVSAQFTAASLEPEHLLWMKPEIREKLYPGLSDDDFRKKILYRGLSGKTVTDFVLESHRWLREYYRMEQAKEPNGRSKIYPVKLPLMPNFRKTYALETEFILKDGENNRPFEDSIGLLPDWRKAGPVWEVPFRTLYTRRMKNLLAAGRCTGASGDAWEITRVIPAAAVTGQVAGLAAASVCEQRKAVYDLSVPELQQKLRQLGFRLKLSEIEGL